MHIAKDAVLAELECNPGFARRIIAALAAKLHDAARELDTYALGTGERRFASWLLRAAGPAEGLIDVRGRTVEILDLARLRAWRERSQRLSIRQGSARRPERPSCPRLQPYVTGKFAGNRRRKS